MMQWKRTKNFFDRCNPDFNNNKKLKFKVFHKKKLNSYKILLEFTYPSYKNLIYNYNDEQSQT